MVLLSSLTVDTYLKGPSGSRYQVVGFEQGITTRLVVLKTLDYSTVAPYSRTEFQRLQSFDQVALNRFTLLSPEEVPTPTELRNPYRRLRDEKGTRPYHKNPVQESDHAQ